MRDQHSDIHSDIHTYIHTYISKSLFPKNVYNIRKSLQKFIAKMATITLFLNNMISFPASFFPDFIRTNNYTC